jgi:hypothetical protein
MTTFGTIASEYKRKESYDNTPEESRGTKPKLLLLGEDSRFYRVVIDGEMFDFYDYKLCATNTLI